MHRQKYHSAKVRTSEGVFDSKHELKRWEELKELEQSGIISDLRRQVKFELIPSQKLKEPRPRRAGYTQRTEKAVCYIADFVYKKDGQTVVEDAKGVLTDTYILKRKLMLHVHGIQIKEIY